MDWRLREEIGVCVRVEEFSERASRIARTGNWKAATERRVQDGGGKGGSQWSPLPDKMMAF
jgi:hypothetical protein